MSNQLDKELTTRSCRTISNIKQSSPLLNLPAGLLELILEQVAIKCYCSIDALGATCVQLRCICNNFKTKNPDNEYPDCVICENRRNYYDCEDDFEDWMNQSL